MRSRRGVAEDASCPLSGKFGSAYDLAASFFCQQNVIFIKRVVCLPCFIFNFLVAQCPDCLHYYQSSISVHFISIIENQL